MADLINIFGKNAGLIWKTLEKMGPTASNKIMKTTGLKKQDFYTAAGWLAKENKIWFDKNMFSLGENNWDQVIGENAGKIWKLIFDLKEIDVKYIPRFTGLSDVDTYFALGWLAREGKLSVKEIKPKRTSTIYSIKI
jgi:hypothetical protein